MKPYLCADADAAAGARAAAGAHGGGRHAGASAGSGGLADAAAGQLAPSLAAEVSEREAPLLDHVQLQPSPVAQLRTERVARGESASARHRAPCADAGAGWARE